MVYLVYTRIRRRRVWMMKRREKRETKERKEVNYLQGHNITMKTLHTEPRARINVSIFATPT